ncbi:RDD family protein [Achromobacter kerstersii]|uniref:RDD family protein n=1 Tax=Achromobacter kerstersii TaxID=1353890 RepID=UPI001581C66D|nr:RDD family protein [Achromobacter kerstersii]
MQCPKCNWQNPASNTRCFSCQAALPVKPATAKPAAATPKTAPSRPQQASLFPSIWSRLGATAIDGMFMAVAIIVLINAASYTYEGLAGTPSPILLTIAAGLLGWLLPAFMDAWGNGSPGKRLLKMRVVNRKGQAPGLLRSIWRHQLKYTLNVVLPGIFHHIQQMIFGERAMHNSLAGTHVVSSTADARAIAPAVAKARAVTSAGKFLFIVFGMLTLIVGGVIIGLAIKDSDKPDNPLHAEITRLDLVSDPVRRLAENHYQRTRAFPATLADLGVTQESLLGSGFSKLELNPVNGVLRFTIAGTPPTDGSPSLAGKHLAYLPEMRSEKKGGGIRRWECGSDDIAPDDRIYRCRHDTSAFAR